MVQKVQGKEMSKEGREKRGKERKGKEGRERKLSGKIMQLN